MAEALLFEHEDGRYAVAMGPESPDFALCNPKWHRLGPVDVSALSTNAGEAAPVAYLVSNLPSGEPSLCFEEERGDYGSDTYTPVFEPLFLAAGTGRAPAPRLLQAGWTCKTTRA
ncbi:hypothetical protein [Variovorax paradoxus]|uniref:hypothetical protein n=1 Tax=Variovorax paradoxus TaxID=34073 RepID=UPI001933C36C|nr:hypothetical protein INQ48_18230 [Variovorax paradoxus]